MRRNEAAPEVGAPLHRAFTPEMRGIDTKNRTIDFVASTEAVDRYGDILRVKGFQTDELHEESGFLLGAQVG